MNYNNNEHMAVNKEFFKNLDDQRIDFYTDMLISALNKVAGNWDAPWLTSSNLIPQNFEGTNKYSGTNKLFLSWVVELKGYNTPVFVTAKRARQEGLSIQKDEKPYSIMVVRNCISAYKDKLDFIRERSLPEDPTPAEYNKMSEEDKCLYRHSRYTDSWQVYNIDQTNMREVLPERYEETVKAFDEMKGRDDRREVCISQLDKLIEEQGWLCPLREDQVRRAFFHYDPSDPYISVPPKERMISDERYYSTLIHEMTHSTVLEQTPDGEPLRVYDYSVTEERAREELVAEMGAAMVLMEMGVNAYISKDNAEYLKHWFGHLGAEEVTEKVTNPEILSLAIDLKKMVNAASLDFDLMERLADKAYPIEDTLGRAGIPLDKLTGEELKTLTALNRGEIPLKVEQKIFKRFDSEKLNSEGREKQRAFVRGVVIDTAIATDIIFKKGIKMDLSQFQGKPISCGKSFAERQAERKAKGEETAWEKGKRIGNYRKSGERSGKRR